MARNYKISITPELKVGELQRQLDEFSQKYKMPSLTMDSGSKTISEAGKAGTKAGKAYSQGVNKEAKTISQTLIHAFKNRFIFAAIDTSLRMISTGFKDAVNNVVELDKALTELRKVSDLSGQELESFINKAYNVGVNVARTGKEMIEASTQFAKMGVTDEAQLLNLAEMASMYQNIADSEITAGQAASFINSQMKAFADSGLTAEEVISKVNEVSNNFAVSSTDISQALTKTAGAMATYGNDMDETIALVTGGAEIMTGQASKVARGWRTIGANVVKLASETDTFTAANGKVSVSLKDTDGNLRSTYEIMESLWPVWKTLNEEEQSNIALNLAGKSHMEVFASTMNNFENASRALAASRGQEGEAADSARKENEKYLDSIEGRIQRFRSAWEQLSVHIISSDFLSTLIESATKLIEILDKLVNKIGTIPTLGVLLGGAGVVHALKNLKETKKALGDIGAAFELLKKGGGLTEVASAATGLSEALIAGAGGAALLVALYGAAYAAGKRMSFDNQIKELKDLQDEISDTQSEYDKLKNKEGELNTDEKTRLAILENQLEILKEQKKYKYEDVRKSFEKEVDTARRGNAYGTPETLGEEFISASERYYYAQNQILEAQKKINKLKNDDKLNDDERNKAIEKQRKIITDAQHEQELALDTLSRSYDKIAAKEEELQYLDYSELTDKAKNYYDEIHGAYLAMSNDNYEVQKAIMGVVDLVSSDVWDSWGIDITSIETVDDLVEQVADHIDEIPKDAELTFRVDDKDVTLTAEQVEALKGLASDEQTMIIKAFATGDWSEVQEYIDKDNPPQGFMDIVTEFTPEDEKDEFRPKITYDVNSDDVDAKNDELGNLEHTGYNIDVTYTYRSRGLSPHATGKAPGQPGGMSWLGDEGSRQHPMPELVVGSDGAYLAGTQGWELRELKTSDRVYTAAQTRRLLGGKQSYQFGADEIPRYAKGKSNTKKIDGVIVKGGGFRKEEKKSTTASIERLEFELDAGLISEEKYIKKLKNILKKRKNLTEDQYRDLIKTIRDYEAEINEEKAKAQADAYETAVKYGRMTYDEAKERLSTLKDDLGEDFAGIQADLAKTALDTAVEMVKAGVGSWEKVSAAAEEYISIVGEVSAEGIEAQEKLFDTASDLVAEGKISVEEYEALFIEMYGTIDHESERYCNAEKKRHEALVKNLENQIDKINQTLDVSLGILEKIRDIRDKIVDSIQEAKDKQQKLADIEEEQQKAEVEYAKELVRLQNELTKARSKTVKVYREGVGWTYQKDVEAVREAQEAIEDLNEDYQEQIDDLEEQKEEVLKPDETKRFSLLDAAISGLETVSSVIGTAVSVASLAKLFGLFAGGKKPGEPGGLSILGDEATSSANPKPELVVGPNGAYLAGTQGWQIANLSAADRVYTAAETKRMFGSTNRGAIPSVFGTSNGHEVVGSGLMSNNYTYNFDRLELPNVTDANSFVKELQELPNLAIQMTGKR